jgi:hypothetical protein
MIVQKAIRHLTHLNIKFSLQSLETLEKTWVNTYIPYLGSPGLWNL